MNTRSIKFRIWDGWQMVSPQIFLPKQEVMYLDINNAIATDDSIWMQFTGVVDKNGREIYECDEVIAVPSRGGPELTSRGIVEYDELAGRFAVRTERGLQKLDSNYYVFEVVGNAFQ